MRLRPVAAWVAALLSVIAIVGVVGISPAQAHASGAHVFTRGGPMVGFTHAAERSNRRATCQPSSGLCPQSNTVWSGYTAVEPLGRLFSSVSASWVQTAARCGKGSDAWTLFWVGLDGAANGSNFHSVEQGGTSAQCIGGRRPQYEAWWEMYPANSVQLTYPVSVGDAVTANVTSSTTDGTITITVDDTTSGNSLTAVVSNASAPVNPDTYTVTVDGVTTGPTPYDSSLCGPSDPNGPCGTSAEWVVEAPSGAPGPYPLAHYRTVHFQAASAVDAEGNQGTILNPNWNTDALDLTTEAGTVKARVSGLNKAGSAFADTWMHP
jgi:hypothetical protein